VTTKANSKHLFLLYSFVRVYQECENTMLLNTNMLFGYCV